MQLQTALFLKYTSEVQIAECLNLCDKFTKPRVALTKIDQRTHKTVEEQQKRAQYLDSDEFQKLSSSLVEQLDLYVKLINANEARPDQIHQFQKVFIRLCLQNQ